MTTNEAKKMKGKDPCWDGYKMLGTKPKGGKQVPNCIPEETMEENIARLVSNSIKRVTAVKPTPQQKADMRMNREEANDPGEYDYEGDMARSDLRSIIHNAQQLHDMMEDNTNLPEWLQAKITKAEDYISSAANYMRSEMNEEVVAKGLSEMDKSQTPPGRDGSNDSNAGKKEYTAKATTAKKVAKDAEKILNKELNKKQGVAEEVKLDEISAETQAAYSKASHKDRMTQAVKVIGSSGHDKEAAQKLKVRNAGLKRISDRIHAKTPKVTPAPKPNTPVANDYGYGKGRYMGDSVELQGNKIDELSPATLSSYKKAAGQSASNLDKSADKEFASGNRTAGVALTNKANKRFSGIVRATKKQ